MKNKVLLVIGVLLAVVFVSNQLASGLAAPAQRVTAADPAERNARQAVQEVLRIVRKSFDEKFPRQNEVQWDPGTKTMTISLYPSYFGAREANAALQDIKFLTQWRELLENMRGTAELIGQEFDTRGIPEATVRIELYDNNDPSLLLASLSAAGVEYDAVDSTPAGQLIGQAEAAP